MFKFIIEGALTIELRMPKSKGYNWKARQAQRGEGNSRSNGDQDSSANGSTEHYRTDLSDANVVVLPAKRKPVEDESSKLEPKRKKLSNREKKRLTKIVEVKEKKKRVIIPINAHTHVVPFG